MEGVSVNIAFRQSWNNLVDLPANLSGLLYNANVSPQEVIIELVLQAGQKSYVGWSGMSSQSPRTISMDPIFAHSLKLADKQLVTSNVKIKNSKTSTVFLEPERSSDWELVELHASYIESKLIEQSRCVALNQVLVVYPTKTSSVRLLVKDIGDPNTAYALIDPFAEISIAPKLKEKKRSSSQSVKSARSIRSSNEDLASGPFLLRRGISLPNDIFTNIQPLSNAIEIYSNTEEMSHDFHNAEYVTVSVVPGPSAKAEHLIQELPASKNGQSHPKEQHKEGNNPTEASNVVAKLRKLSSAPRNTVGLSEGLSYALNVHNKVGFKVVIRSAGKSVSKRPSTLVVHPFITQSKKVDNIQLHSSTKAISQGKIAKELSNQLFQKSSLITEFPITNHLRIPPIANVLPHGGILSFKRNDDPHAWIKPYSIDGGGKVPPKVEVGSDILTAVGSAGEATTGKLEPIYGSIDTRDEIVDHLASFDNSSIMLFGTPGSGKTLMMRWIAQILQHQYGYFVKFIPCETFMNESFDQLCNHFSKWVNEAVWHEPSILILDNLDRILSAEVEHGDSSVSNQLTEFLSSLLQKINSQKNTNISLLVSGQSKETFNKGLTASHLIEEFVHLKPPGKAARFEILEQFLLKRLGCTLQFDLMDIVLETEGFLPNDLKVLSERIFYECHYQRELENVSDGSLLVSRPMLENAIAGYQPSALRGVKLQKSTTGWSDIGGLTKAKNVLLETLEWPTRYAPIFANCPLRLRSGILLYGYPGCGKTLLASAIAGQSGLNFISIKGPEILNKYIGASEQSVRELFDRAQAAKPCILFFDEFDSIAPKRGHDSTGVTDRVVNQMLTQMDGAEGLDGVYVLAATSRPDLIDSALLRPGRLDKSIVCDMPNFDDRLDILQRVCLRMKLSENVNLNDIAGRTDGFSGADIQGLGYNAYLKAVHDRLANQGSEVATTSDDKKLEFFQTNSKTLQGKSPAAKIKLLQQAVMNAKEMEASTVGATATKARDTLLVIITKEHFDESLKETKPSISASEMAKLSKIYTQFLTGRDGNMPDGSASTDIGGRTTLM